MPQNSWAWERLPSYSRVQYCLSEGKLKRRLSFKVLKHIIADIKWKHLIWQKKRLFQLHGGAKDGEAKYICLKSREGG